MIKHTETENMDINFSKLEERIMAINDPNLGKFNSMKRMINNISKKGKPTLVMATGGSYVVALYLQLLLEREGIICEVIEPRDYFYKANNECFSNLVVISASGKSNGIDEALKDFKGNRYLVCENEKKRDYEVVAWNTELYDKEKSFISLATTLGPITLLLDSQSSKLTPDEIRNINVKIKELLKKSKEKIAEIDINFKDTSLIQIMSGYETKPSSALLESNLTEVGLATPVIHDKGSFCHGRSNLLFRYPNSQVIYLTHELKDFDHLLIDIIKKEYQNLLLLSADDIDDVLWKEYYLLLQAYFLSKKIAEDKETDLTCPEYNPQLVKTMYKYRGEM